MKHFIYFLGDLPLLAYCLRAFVRRLAMANVVTVTRFQIAMNPSQFYPNKKQNQTRNKKSAKAYEILVEFEDGKRIRDQMIYLNHGAARDCYRLEELPMVLKWFQEVNDPRYKDLHPGELAGFQQVAARPCAKHLPKVYAIGHREVNDNSQQLQQVDCCLSEFVGPTLAELISTLGEVDKSVVRCLFVKLLRMMQRFLQSKVQWECDFHSMNICYCMRSGVWKLVDLEGILPPDKDAIRAVNCGAQRLLKDLKNRPGRLFEELSRCLQTYCVMHLSKSPFDGSDFSLEMIALELGVDMNTLEARNR